MRYLRDSCLRDTLQSLLFLLFSGGYTECSMGAEKVFWSLWHSQCWAQCLKLKTVHEMFLSRDQEGRIDEGGREEGNGRERGRKKKERGKEGNKERRRAGGRKEGIKKEKEKSK